MSAENIKNELYDMYKRGFSMVDIKEHAKGLDVNGYCDAFILYLDNNIVVMNGSNIEIYTKVDTE